MQNKQKKNLLLAFVAVALLSFGYAGGYITQKLARLENSFAQTVAIAPAPTTEQAINFPTPDFNRQWPEWQTALTDWQEIARQIGAKAVDTNVVDAMTNEADRMTQSVNIYGAYNKLEQALKLAPNTTSLWLKFANVARERGSDRQALSAYLIAEALHPDDVEKASLYLGLAKIYGTHGDNAQPQQIAALEKLLALSPDAELQKKLDVLRGSVLEITDFKQREDSDTPDACFTFSWPLRDDGSVNYEDFVTIKPAGKYAVIATDKQLCLRGFFYGKNYDITLKTGLPTRSHVKLAQDTSRNALFNNRTPRLSFQNDTYIVPRLNSLGVPLRGVNVDIAHVEILQINDRNLVSQIIDSRVLQNSTYDYAISQLRDDYGHSIWDGYLDLKKIDNKTTATAIPFSDLVKNPEPGLYAIVAQPAEREDKTSPKNLKLRPVSSAEPVIQWLVVTDVGLTNYSGEDGLHVAVRSYDSGKPLSGIKLRLVSRDNSVLADTSSDTNGHAAFADALLRGKGGKAAKLIQAFGAKGDFTFMDLGQPALDLSANNIEGRDAPKKADVFLYSERGIYRPGDMMHLSALLRDNNGNAMEKAPPLTVKILRPDGVLFSKFLLQPHDDALGGYHTDVAMPENARMGVWRAEVYTDPTESALGYYNWQVEDFVPARMEIKISLPEKAMLAKDAALSIPVQADYLYGAPAAKSTGDASLDLRAASVPAFKDFADYQFGLLDATITLQHVELTLPETDDKGASVLAVTLKDIPATSQPLEALLHASVFDDTGRAVNRTAILPVSRPEPFLGLKEAGGNDTESEWRFSAERKFQLVAVDRSGKQVAQKSLRYRLVREEYRYDWYSANDMRNYQTQIYDMPVTSDTVDVPSDAPAVLSFDKLHYGTYRLEVLDPAQTTDRLTAVSIRFNVGWTERAMTSQDKPDALQLRLDHKNYHSGDTAKLFIKAPFSGEAELVLARESVLEQRVLHLPKEGLTVDIPVTDAWGAGVYALVHAYRPGEKITVGAKTPARAPGRAAGAIWAAMDPAPKTLDIVMDLPEITTPRQKLTVPMHVIGAQQAEITVAAVDEGILQLTDFKTPDAEKHFYAKRRLGLEIRDSYGRLLDPNVDSIGTVRSGGDQAGRSAANLPGKWIKPVALFSGPVKLDEKGDATIAFDLPEFNGKLRLMAVAYSRDKLGHAEQNMIVRDKVVVNLGLPRFLAPDDTADLSLNLDNIDGDAGEATLQLATTGGVTLGDYPKKIQLDKKQKQQLKFALHGKTLGPASLHMTLTLPDGTVREQDWDLTVRPTQTYQTTMQQGILQSGKSFDVDDDLLRDVLRDGAIVSAAFGTVPDLQLARTLRELDRYPYGCLEQTSSRLLPLLYLSDVVKESGIKDKNDIPTKEVIDGYIARILSMQRADGSFSLWDGYGDTEPFLSLYVIDILQRAQEQDYHVPDYALDKALSWLQEDIKAGDFNTPVLHRRAYGYYLLAKAGLIEPGQIRYFAERYGGSFVGRKAPAFLAAALTQIGDTKGAARYWKMALNPQIRTETSAYYDYGSDVRDSLIALTLATEAGEQTHAFANTVNGYLSRESWLSTQDHGWIILAAHTLYQNSKDVRMTLNDAAIDATAKGPLARSWSGADLQALQGDGQSFRNDGEAPVYYTVAVNAIPTKQQPAASEGFTVLRRFFTRSGKQVDLADVKANDMLVAVIEGTVTDKRIAEQALLVDLLPAGLELESAQFGKGQNVGDFAWIGALTPGTYQEMRDDRFIAAFNPSSLYATTAEEHKGPALMKDQFRFAYAVRAVTKGEFVLPATTIEAMYQPQFHALTEPATLHVK